MKVCTEILLKAEDMNSFPIKATGNDLETLKTPAANGWWTGTLIKHSLLSGLPGATIAVVPDPAKPWPEFWIVNRKLSLARHALRVIAMVSILTTEGVLLLSFGKREIYDDDKMRMLRYSTLLQPTQDHSCIVGIGENSLRVHKDGPAIVFEETR